MRILPWHFNCEMTRYGVIEPVPQARQTHNEVGVTKDVSMASDRPHGVSSTPMNLLTCQNHRIL